MNNIKWLRNREYGLSFRWGECNFIMNQVYRSMRNVHFWNEQKASINTGAIFNLEFNTDGNVLVAACEQKSLLLFDVISRKNIFSISDAHNDNVNCIKFLDNRHFATGSDDETVALWDIRNLNQKLRVLRGHSNWVKNVEYSSKNKLLVTSSFDGSILTWDINSVTEQGLISQKVFHTSGLMRCRITPNGDKLVLCTSGGYIMIVHNLDLTTLHRDLCGFRPTIYRLMQMGNQYIPQAAKYDYIFSHEQKFNRVELITDFPTDNDAEVIGALQIHPEGKCILSRNVSSDENSEWSCVHDINEEPLKNSIDGSDGEDENNIDDVSGSSDKNEPLQKKRRKLCAKSNIAAHRRRGRILLHCAMRRVHDNMPTAATNNNERSNLIPDIWAAELTVEDRALRQHRSRNSSSVNAYNYVYAISSGVLPLRDPSNNEMPRSNGTAHTSRNSAGNRQREDDNFLHPYHLEINDSLGRMLNETFDPDAEYPILENAKKLMYYIKERNENRGIIKEPSFSADGRIIASPYSNGIRLLAYNKDCSEFPRNSEFDEVKSQPRKLTKISTITSHKKVVFCTKFSPREPLLVSGCQAGRVIWYNPNL